MQFSHFVKSFLQIDALTFYFLCSIIVSMTNNYHFSLSEIVRSKGMTKSDVARACGMSRQAVGFLLGCDIQQVRVDTVQKLCSGLGVTPNHLFGITPLSADSGAPYDQPHTD